MPKLGLLVPRPAATPRAPQRKSRLRGSARAYDKKTKQERFIQALAVGATRAEAAEVALTTYRATVGWLDREPELKSLVEKAEAEGKKTRDEAKAEAKAGAIAKLEDKLLLKGEKALGNFDILLKSEAEKILLATSQDVLDRIGVGVKRGGDVNVAVGVKIDLTAEDIYRAYREAQKQLKEG